MPEIPKTFLFVDIETTGLKKDAQLLEIAAKLVVAKNLQKVAEFHVLVKPRAAISDANVWDPVATEFHCKNGLLHDIVAKESHFPEEALLLFLEWLDANGLPAKSCTIAGSSVHTDIAFLKKQYANPIEWEKFCHRFFDLSTMRVYSNMVGLPLFGEKTVDTHRAMDDVNHDIEQLKVAIQKGKDLAPGRNYMSQVFAEIDAEEKEHAKQNALRDSTQYDVVFEEGKDSKGFPQ